MLCCVWSICWRFHECVPEHTDKTISSHAINHAQACSSSNTYSTYNHWHAHVVAVAWSHVAPACSLLTASVWLLLSIPTHHQDSVLLFHHCDNGNYPTNKVAVTTPVPWPILGILISPPTIPHFSGFSIHGASVPATAIHMGLMGLMGIIWLWFEINRQT